MREDILQAICELDCKQGLELLGEGVALEGEGGQFGQLHEFLGEVR
jgi:hypothetical protein